MLGEAPAIYPQGLDLPQDLTINTFPNLDYLN